MFVRTSLKARANNLSKLSCVLFVICFFSGSYIAPALSKEQIDVDGKSFLIGLPSGLCQGANTAWGIDYKKFLKKLGAAASGKPRIVLVLANCEFTRSSNPDGLPTTWGYIAFDNSVGRYWFGQHSLNKRLMKEFDKLQLKQKDSVDLTEITNSSLKKIKSELSIGDIVQLGEPISTQEGFLVSAVALMGSRGEALGVYLSTVTFIRNRQIVTFAIYKKASDKSNLEQVRSIAKKFLESLS